MLRLKRDLSKGVYRTEYSPLFQAIHFFFLFSLKILFQVCGGLLFFWFEAVVCPESVEHENAWWAPLLAGLMLLAETQIFTFSLLFAVFCQDRSVRRVTLWAAAVWFSEFFELAIELFAQSSIALHISVLRLNHNCVCLRTMRCT